MTFTPWIQIGHLGILEEVKEYEDEREAIEAEKVKGISLSLSLTPFLTQSSHFVRD